LLGLIEGYRGQVVRQLWKRLSDVDLIRRPRVSAGVGTDGRHAYLFTPPVVWYPGDTGTVAICRVGASVEILFGRERINRWVTTSPVRETTEREERPRDGRPSTRGQVCIGGDVWLGGQSTIMTRVTIGGGAVVVRRSVGTRDLAPYVIVAGVAARLVRLRFTFTPTPLGALMRTASWEPRDKSLVDRAQDRCAPEIDSFVAKYRPP
jgi:acetyltransferase-like isoleucine patch superfamily enzyme